MNCGYSSRGADFDWQGFDEMGAVSASGDADVGEDGILIITISSFMGDEASFKARPC